ncbi:MAG: phosphate ABC transporter substrate-binding protein PstS family protein [Actinomycetota bacterium]
MRRWRPLLCTALLATAAGLNGCGGANQSTTTGSPSGAAALAGAISIDGSSTVYPITEAVAEEFQQANPKVKVTVGISGTGGGFKKFGRGETDISDASRPIKVAEAKTADEAVGGFIELPVAYDALSIVVNPKNDWANDITVAELKKLWEPAAQGKIMKWNQIRASWPDRPIKLYGAGSDSGTFDYFTDAIVGEEGSSRGDYTASEDDNVLVQGVTNDPNALGYFGLAYYLENKDKLKALPVDDGVAANGAGGIEPTAENVRSGQYQPLARPIFIYVGKKATERPELQKFVEFYLEKAGEFADEVGYVPLQPEVCDLAQQRFGFRILGSMFQGGSQVGVKLDEVMKAQGGAK